MTESLPSRAPYAEMKIGPNRLALLKDGLQAYPAMLAAISGAKSTICLETYILEDDELGLRFIDALCERAKLAPLEIELVQLMLDAQFDQQPVHHQ